VLELLEPVFGLSCPDVEPLPVEEPVPLWPDVEPLEPVLPYEPLVLPGLVLELLEPALGLFWP